MKKTLTFLVATTALTATIGLPVLGAIRAPSEGAASGPFAAVYDTASEALPFLFVSDDDDDEEDDDDDHGKRGSYSDDDDDDDCDDDDDDDECGTAANNPAPTGTVAPPSNGLFGNGAPPQVQVN